MATDNGLGNSLVAVSTTVEEAPGLAAVEQPVPKGRRSWKGSLRYLGVLPFAAYIAIFLLIPTGELIVDAFKGNNGGFTTANVTAIVHGQYLQSFESSIELAALSALFGGVLGFFLTTAIVARGTPNFVRPVIVTFSGMAANFAGIPLAFAFTSTIGVSGVVTALVKHFGVNLANVIPLTSGVLGLAVVYTYFQFPLMVLLMVPAIDGLRKEWREAAQNLGATAFQYWRRVAMPILFPSLLGAMVLLFGGAFSAYATAEALSGSTGNLVTEYIANLLNGNIFVNQAISYALAFGMIVIITVTMILYSALQRRANKWLR